MIRPLFTLLALCTLGHSFDPLKTVQRDLAALRMRATARHIMRPKTVEGRGQCEVIARSIAAARSNGTYVVDAFADAARLASCDPDTKAAGGLLGERMPQGWCRAREVDQAAFTRPIGEVSEPLESDFGWHLVLVEERIGCRFDNGKTRLIPRLMSDGLTRSIVVG